MIFFVLSTQVELSKFFHGADIRLENTREFPMDSECFIMEYIRVDSLYLIGFVGSVHFCY